jgi:predicted HTH transcriptional regulator
LLRSTTRQALIGCGESDQLEFKAEPYVLNTERQKQELAMDVCSLANATGGAIVIGIKTTKSGLHATDIATELRPFPASLHEPERIAAVLMDWIYPPLDSLGLEWIPDRAASQAMW